MIKFSISGESDDEKLRVSVIDEYFSFFLTNIVNFTSESKKQTKKHLRLSLKHTCMLGFFFPLIRIFRDQLEKRGSFIADL